MNKKTDPEEYKRIKNMANAAKDRLNEIVYRLHDIGEHRQAAALMTLIYDIEEWQNK